MNKKANIGYEVAIAGTTETYKFNNFIEQITPSVIQLHASFGDEEEYKYHDLIRWGHVDDPENKKLTVEDLYKADWYYTSDGYIEVMMYEYLLDGCNKKFFTKEVEESIRKKNDELERRVLSYYDIPAEMLYEEDR